VEDFLDRHPGTPTVRHPDSTLALSADGLPENLTIHVLRPKLDPKG
jgi:hypothetical protein